MKAVILAGGKGTRLAPFTTIFPKPLVPLGNRPILDIIIHQLSYYGFHDIVLTTGYLAELIQAYFQNGHNRRDVHLTYIKEQEPTGTAGSLALIPDLHDTFLAMNGDVLTSMDYSKLIAFHKAQGGILTIGMHRKCVKIDLGVMDVDAQGMVTGYLEKPEKTYLVSMGVYVYEPAVLNYIERGQYLDFPDLVLTLLEKGKKVVGYPCDDYWLDIGRQEDYAKAQDEFESLQHLFLPGQSTRS